MEKREEDLFQRMEEKIDFGLEYRYSLPIDRELLLNKEALSFYADLLKEHIIRRFPQELRCYITFFREEDFFENRVILGYLYRPPSNIQFVTYQELPDLPVGAEKKSKGKGKLQEEKEVNRAIIID